MVPQKEQYITKQEFKEYKNEASLMYEKIHKKANEITEMMAKRDVFEVFIDKFDRLCGDFQDFMIRYATESERQANVKHDMEDFKLRAAYKSDLQLLIKDGKYKMLWGGLIGVVVTFIVLGLIGTFFPTF